MSNCDYFRNSHIMNEMKASFNIFENEDYSIHIREKRLAHNSSNNRDDIERNRKKDRIRQLRRTKRNDIYKLETI